MRSIQITARADNFIGAQLTGIPSDDAARLIAAAPDLLAALNAALDCVDDDYAAGYAEPEWAAQARAAIARATGGDA